MQKYKLISVDLAKHVFQVAAFHEDGTIAFNKKVNRSKLLDSLRQCEPTLVVTEACYSANYWGRAIEKLGHHVRQVSPRVVKAMLIGNKNDNNDAIAIGEAAQRPTVHRMVVKTVEQQDIQCLIRSRELLIKERTATANQMRGFLAEYGVILTKGLSQLRHGLIYILEDADNELSECARRLLNRQHKRLLQLDTDIEEITMEMTTLAKQQQRFDILLTIPGIGPIIACMILSLANDAREFKNGRQFAAWLGLTPVQYSSGSVNRLGRISKRGNEGLRRLLIHGARAVLNWCTEKDDALSQWLQQLKRRTHSCKVTVALANKLARVVWAVLSSGQPFDIQKVCKAV